MKLVVAPTILALLFCWSSLSTLVAQACDCSPYLEPFEKELSLGADITGIGLQVLDPSGRTVALNESINESRRARLLSDPSIPAECREKFAREKGLLDRVSVGATLSMGLGTGADTIWTDFSPGSDPAMLLAVAERAYAVEPHSTCGNGMDLEACREANAGSRLDSYISRLNAMPADRKTAAFESAARRANLGHVLTGEESRALDGFFQLISAKDFSDYRARSRALAGEMGEREKILLLAMMGGQMSLGYDLNRAGDSSDGKVVSAATLFNTSKRNFSFTGLDRTDTAGVCRDMAVAQVMLAHDLGLKRAVTISWTAEEGHHTSVAVQANDSDGHDVYLVNYDKVTLQRGPDGSRLISLRNDPMYRDHSLAYYLHDGDGNPLGTVTSGKGKFLLEAAGLDSRTFDPLARPDNDILSGDLFIGKRGKGRVSAVAGKDENGDLYMGASGDVTWGTGLNRASIRDSESWSNSGKAAVFAGTQFQATPNRTEFNPDRTDLVMAGVSHTTFTPTLKLDSLPGLRLQANAGLDVMAQVHADHGSVTKTQIEKVPGAVITSTWQETQYFEVGWDAESQFRLGGTGEFELPNTGTLFRLTPTLRLKPDTNDIRATPEVASNWRIYPSSLELSGELYQRLSSGWRAHARGQFVWDRMGSRGLAAVGASGQDFGAEAGASGRISAEDDVPEYLQDSSQSRGFVNARYRLAPELDLGGSISSDFLLEHQGNLYLQGTFW